MTKFLYSIHQVDGDDCADEIGQLQDATGLTRANYGTIQWWFASFEDHPAAYLGIMRSLLGIKTAYLVRVGVLPKHRGNGLQFRLMKTAERWARRQSFLQIISDTTQNPPSANNFIRAGYHIYEPPARWAQADTIYWRKILGSE